MIKSVVVGSDQNVSVAVDDFFGHCPCSLVDFFGGCNATSLSQLHVFERGFFHGFTLEKFDQQFFSLGDDCIFVLVEH